MSTPGSVAPSSIDVIGAEANNLKNVDVTFPLRRISVVTGVSGSGKSSLLVDTLAAEGSRRMRTFLGAFQEELERDDVKAFVGALPPTIFVGQRGFRPSVRTTIGTATGFLSVLRRLFVLASTPYSELAKDHVQPPSPETYAGWISKQYRGPAEIWAVPAWNQRTDGVVAVKRLASYGVQKVIIRSETDSPRIRESGRIVSVSEFKGLNPAVSHTIEALIDTLAVNGSPGRPRLKEALERAFAAGNRLVTVALPKAAGLNLEGPFGPQLDSAKHWVHPDDPTVFARPSAHLLSFNAPEHADSGACRDCDGTGIGRQLIEAVLIAWPERSMHEGAFSVWTEKNYKYVNIQHETIEGLRGMSGFSPDVRWSKLPEAARALVLDGSGDQLVFDRDRTGRKFGKGRPFVGFRRIILVKSSTGTKAAAQLAAFVEEGPCGGCGGRRWSPQASSLRVAGRGIGEILGMTFAQVDELAKSGGAFARAVPPNTRSLVEAVRRHAHSIVSAGLSYLTADRGMRDVSEGESRRIRLARVLDTGERGLCLLLDEPARGLHEADLSRLALALSRLRDKHTIILNEHRQRLWGAADWQVEVGPAAGPAGGQITYAGPRRRVEIDDDQPLRRSLLVSTTQPRLTIRGASIHNVQSIDCELPLGRLTCISGVSGSGKSSFVRGVLAPGLLESVGAAASDFALRRGRWSSVGGADSISEVVALDQVMPPPNRRSLVATFTGLFDPIRKVFGSSPDARRAGLSASDFGVNAGRGRCPACMGVGEVTGGGLSSACPACGGSRYGHAVLSVRVAGLNLQELLDRPVERLGHGDSFNMRHGLIMAMCELGIGYITLGRRIDTLSGGEVQRLRLAIRLGTVSTGSMLFILDEPAVGLHPRDVRHLATALERVLDNGRNTIVMVEHDLNLVRSADWVLEFGPGSGPNGGKIIFEGTPGQLAKRKTPTGLALAGKLATPAAPAKIDREVAPIREFSIDEQVARTTALLRTLVSGEAPMAMEDADGPAEPVVVLAEHFWTGREGWEVAGLDCELPKLLLDVQGGGGRTFFAELLAAWAAAPDSWLAIQPFLAEMQVWGKDLPKSVIQAVLARVSKEGLRLVTAKGDALPRSFDIRTARASGERFTPTGATDDARARVLRDACAIGGRYVELRDRSGTLRAMASDRLLDLDSAIIAPMAPIPAQFSRLDPRGRCPMCKGNRVVITVSESLAIGNPKVTPHSEHFLTPQANAVMRGVRRNELIPFLRRLSKEGLWNLSAPFESLDRAHREVILFGFWGRPGAGSFLKMRASPEEVSSWLRWDGLFPHLLSQVHRCRDTDWVSRIHENIRAVRCLLCEGSGLRLFARLLRVGGLPLDEWTRLSDPRQMLDRLGMVGVSTLRQRRMRQRLLHCLAPLAERRASDAPAAVVARAVESFTTMTAVRPSRVSASDQHA